VGGGGGNGQRKQHYGVKEPNKPRGAMRSRKPLKEVNRGGGEWGDGGNIVSYSICDHQPGIRLQGVPHLRAVRVTRLPLPIHIFRRKK